MGSDTIEVLAFGAHPDDAELGCGGTLYKLSQAGRSTAVIDVTEGELGTRGTVAERYRESAEAAGILKLTVRENLKIPDARIELTPENRSKVIEVLRRYRPRLVFAPYPDDRHPDHIYTSRLISESCFYAGLKNMNPGAATAHRPQLIIYYMMTYEFIPSFVVDISREFPVKLEAIRAYRSQFYNPGYAAEETFISSRAYMEALEFRARHFGWRSGVRYGEPFWLKEPPALDDVFSLLPLSVK